jgi:hypothetical protein
MCFVSGVDTFDNPSGFSLVNSPNQSIVFVLSEVSRRAMLPSQKDNMESPFFPRHQRLLETATAWN